ncbi:MAG: peroxiredoxin [Ignavibacteriae bacterium]|nr:peroxiredoxin [Ignavibacteriota bacterium]
MADLGTKAPDFTLADTARAPRSLGEFLGKKTVLAFYPGAFTGVCTQEMCTFQDSLAQLNTLDAHIVGISVDSTFANGEFAAKNKIAFPLLSDHSRVATKAYGVELPNFAGIDGYNVAQRSIFVLDADGVIRYKWVAENPGILPDYDVVMAELQKI